MEHSRDTIERSAFVSLPSNDDTSSESLEKFGGVNYSPKHPSSVAVTPSARNINFKNLLLEISPHYSSNIHSPLRETSIAMNILDDHNSKREIHNVDANVPLFNLKTTQNILPSTSLMSPSVDIESSKGLSDESTVLRSPFSCLPHNTSLHISGNSEAINSDHLKKSNHSDISNGNMLALFNNTSATLPQTNISNQSPEISRLTFKASLNSEELQESTSVNAYPNGPANVLDSVIYLYSDPYLSERTVDINEFDLVLNVAKECKDLTQEFNTLNGERKYLHFPWSHTSSILNELPSITAELAKMDRPGKKALIHCQCGVLRSACVVVAYFMVKFKLSVNEAYDLLKTGTDNTTEPMNKLINEKGHFVQACERICPNMNLIFELMDFGEQIKIRPD